MGGVIRRDPHSESLFEGSTIPVERRGDPGGSVTEQAEAILRETIIRVVDETGIAK